MANFRPQYTNAGQVKIYLQGKVFANGKQSGTSFIDSITPQAFNKFIVDAETWVATELSRQYVVDPFMNENGQPFNTLPQRTQLTIQGLCTWKACEIILDIYFGKSEGTRGQSYTDHCIEQYQKLLMQAEGIDEHGQYSKTPLPGLMLNKNASYRSDAGSPSPRSIGLGVASYDNSSITRSKLTNLNKSLWRGRGRFPF